MRSTGTRAARREDDLGQRSDRGARERLQPGRVDLLPGQRRRPGKRSRSPSIERPVPTPCCPGIILGDAGACRRPHVTSAPQGNWVGAVGSAGYDLGGLERRERPRVRCPAHDGRPHTGQPLHGDAHDGGSAGTSEPLDGLTREAATYYDPNQIRLSLKFNSAYSGNLHLYALDWDSSARRELISVNGQTAALQQLQPGRLGELPDLGGRRRKRSRSWSTARPAPTPCCRASSWATRGRLPARRAPLRDR